MVFWEGFEFLIFWLIVECFIIELLRKMGDFVGYVFYDLYLKIVN